MVPKIDENWSKIDPWAALGSIFSILSCLRQHTRPGPRKVYFVQCGFLNKNMRIFLRDYSRKFDSGANFSDDMKADTVAHRLLLGRHRCGSVRVRSHPDLFSDGIGADTVAHC